MLAQGGIGIAPRERETAHGRFTGQWSLALSDTSVFEWLELCTLKSFGLGRQNHVVKFDREKKGGTVNDLKMSTINPKMRRYKRPHE